MVSFVSCYCMFVLICKDCLLINEELQFIVLSVFLLDKYDLCFECYIYILIINIFDCLCDEGFQLYYVMQLCICDQDK